MAVSPSKAATLFLIPECSHQRDAAADADIFIFPLSGTESLARCSLGVDSDSASCSRAEEEYRAQRGPAAEV